MNILILSAGTRNKIVQYFKETLRGEGRVIVADMSETAPALFEADAYYLVPRITEAGYIDMVLDICRKEKIDGVLSLIDPELSLLALNEKRFEEIGVKVIGSSYELCERTLDKYSLFEWMINHGYRCARSYIDKEAFYADVDAGLIDYPVFVKPQRGSASISVSVAYDRETVDLLTAHEDGLMIQELIRGKEIGVDAYVDMISGELVSVFLKHKLKMRAGETDKAVSFKDERLFELVEKFVNESGFRGQIDIDMFDVGGEYYFSEVNPRFGGGYPHAYASGCNSIAMIMNNLKGIANEKAIGDYRENVLMMKYPEISVRQL